MLILTKRRKFALSSLILSFGLYLLGQIGFEFKYQAIGSLTLLAGILAFWSLKEAAFGLSSWMTTILPMFLTAGIALFYFLLPSSFWTVVPIIIFYLIGMYSLLLTENIFSVAAIRTINLFRSASAVGFLLTLLTSFFLYNAIVSLKMFFYFNFALIFLVSFPLVLAGLWSVNLDERINYKLITLTFLISLIIAEFELILSFWPVTVTVGSLFLTTVVYVLLGLTQAYLSERLFRNTITEYLIVGLIVFLTMVAYTSWG